MNVCKHRNGDVGGGAGKAARSAETLAQTNAANKNQ